MIRRALAAAILIGALLAACVQGVSPCDPTSVSRRTGCTDPYGEFLADGGATP